MVNDQVQRSFFAPTKAWRIAVLLICLLGGFATRLIDLTDPPLDYAPSRQLRSALIARGIYYRIAPDPPAWQREVAQKGENSQEMLEPEIMEHLTGLTYLAVGGEHLWIARLYASLFWTLGGLALYALMRRFVSPDGAIIGLLFYLFDPFALLAGRTFQPDPLMTAAIITAWLSFLKWREEQTFSWAVLAGLACGGAIFIKSTAAFFLFFGLAAVLIAEKGILTLLRDRQVWLVFCLSLLPGLAYYLYGYLLSGQLRGTLAGRLFNPALWDKGNFYLAWLHTTGKVLGHWIALLLALAAIFVIKKKALRVFLWGSWLGFVVFGFAVSYYVTTHSYYLLPIIPLASISLGGGSEWLLDRLGRTKLIWPIRAAGVIALILGVCLGWYIYGREDYRAEPAYYQKVASFVSPQDRIIALSQDYGFRLAYYGWINVQPWQGLAKLREGSAGELLEGSFSSEFAAAMEDYDFFIITRLQDFRDDPSLSRALDDHYQLYQKGGGYRIYNLREPRD